MRKYPLRSDRELIAALRFCLEESGSRPETLDDRAGFHPGTVAALAAGYLDPPVALLRKLCEVLGIPRWLFHLLGVVADGADLGHDDFKHLLERRRRQRAGEPDVTTDLVVEAVEIVSAIGEDAGTEDGATSRRWIAQALERVASRSCRLGERETATLIHAVAVIAIARLECLSSGELEPVVEVLKLAKALEQR
jgi:hypothetical protein